MTTSIPSPSAIAASCQEWLLGLARKEADSGCARLFSFKGQLEMYFAEITASWSANERYALMCASIKLHTGPNMGASA